MERKISLNELDPKKTVYEAIGLSEEEFIRLIDLIMHQYPDPKFLLEELGMSEDDLFSIVILAKSGRPILETIITHWKRKWRDQITLLEYVGTCLLIAPFVKLPKLKKIKKTTIIIVRISRNKPETHSEAICDTCPLRNTEMCPEGH